MSWVCVCVCMCVCEWERERDQPHLPSIHVCISWSAVQDQCCFCSSCHLGDTTYTQVRDCRGVSGWNPSWPVILLISHITVYLVRWFSFLYEHEKLPTTDRRFYKPALFGHNVRTASLMLKLAHNKTKYTARILFMCLCSFNNCLLYTVSCT